MMVTLAPAANVPMLTLTGGVPALPLTMLPADVLRLPVTRAVLLSGISSNNTLVALADPVLETTTVYV